MATGLAAKGINLWRNKLNGIQYIRLKETKYIDGVRYVRVCRSIFGDDPVWVRADVLEKVKKDDSAR